MNSRRWIILAVAIVIGLVAGGLVYNYVQGVEDEANEDVVLVEVFTLTRDIPRGTFGEDVFANGWVQRSAISAEFRPASAITDVSQIAGEVAIFDLDANQIITEKQFVPQAEALATFSSTLEENEVAITISVDQIRGVAGLLVPGDFVNILIDESAVELAGGNVTVADGASVPTQCLSGAEGIDLGSVAAGPQVFFCPAYRYLYQKAQIIAIGRQRELDLGQTVATNPDGSPVTQGTGLLTLAVSLEAAQWIASVPAESLYLSLVPEDYQPVDVAPLAPTPLFPAEDPEIRTPLGPLDEQPAS